MARVYQGTDTVLGRTVAIKVLSASLAMDPAFVARFQREAQSVASLNHPNLVGVYDIGAEGDYHYIVMEYVQGSTLDAVIRQYAPLDADRVVAIASSVCEGLGAAHMKGIIHRDVKPANIMVEPGGRVKVMDFGIAKSGTDGHTQVGRGPRNRQVPGARAGIRPAAGRAGGHLRARLRDVRDVDRAAPHRRGQPDGDCPQTGFRAASSTVCTEPRGACASGPDSHERPGQKPGRPVFEHGQHGSGPAGRAPGGGGCGAGGERGGRVLPDGGPQRRRPHPGNAGTARGGASPPLGTAGGGADSPGRRGLLPVRQPPRRATTLPPRPPRRRWSCRLRPRRRPLLRPQAGLPRPAPRRPLPPPPALRRPRTRKTRRSPSRPSTGPPCRAPPGTSRAC